MDTSVNPLKRRKLEYIDALRGVAILMVIVTHVAPISTNIQPLLASLSAYGRMGVQLFFIASAVTLCMSMGYKHRESHSVMGFFLRRFFRIAPAYYLGVLIYAVLLNHINEKPIPITDITLHLLFLHGFSPHAFMNVVPGGWSIGVEFIFYFLFPWLFRFAFTNPTPQRWFLLISLSFISAQLVRVMLQNVYGIIEDPWQISYWNFANQSIVFIVGMMTFQVLQSDSHKYIQTWKLFSIFLSMTAISLAMYLFKPISHTYLIVCASGLSFACLTLLFSRFPVLSPRWLQSIGKISFSMYLIHFLVISLYQQTPLYDQIIVEPHLKFLINLIVIFGITYLLSRFSFRLIEQPGIRAGKYLASRLSASPNVSDR